MAAVIGGNDTGLLDGSLYLLNRDDKTTESSAGHEEELFVNVSNGNLVVRHTDAYLPSQGEDFAVVRTYNDQGNWNEGVGQNWTITTAVELTQITKNEITLRNADGSYFEYQYDRTTGIYTSTDGPGAYETMFKDSNANWILTRSDQTQITFDGNGTMLQSVDTNGNTITYVYESSKLVQVIDDNARTITYEYGGSQGTELSRIIDSELGVLVEYVYSFGLLLQVTDRNGDVTTYDYRTDGTLARINLPHDPTIDADIGKQRSIIFENGGDETLDYIIDAEGNVTEFIYNFQTQGSTFLGGDTVMVNALGYERYSSNDAEYVQWRLDNGYYATWDYNTYVASFNGDKVYYNQVNEIRANHATTYIYDADGNITLAGTYKTTGGNLNYLYADRYEYDADGNLITLIDANGYALQTSDDQYWRDMRQELGYVDALTGEGLLAAQLTTAQLNELAEFYTTHFEYDGNGNLIKKIDNEDNITTYTYTSFNKIASETNAKGFTTTYTYDVNQNLIEIRDPSGDLTVFAYDTFGNVTSKIVYMDQLDLVDPAKQQVTQYFYDAYGNNVKIIEANAWAITNSDDAYWVEMRKEFGIVDIDGNGKLVANLTAAEIDSLTAKYTSFNTYDQFGNLTQYIDANGGVTTYVYDKDNRLISITDPELSTTVYSYDSVGNRIGVTTTSDNHTTVYVYDRNNMLIAVQDWKTALGNGTDDRTTTYKYDVVGNNTAVTDANGIETTYVYREDNRLVEILSPYVQDGSGNQVQYSTSFSYDSLGNRIQQNDNNGNITNYVYNQNNLIKQTTDPIGNVTQFSYDANLNQVQIVIGAQLAETQRRVLRFSYDDEDQLIAEVNAEGNVTRYNLDAVGNRVQVVDALERVYEFEYDAQNQQIIETKPSVTHPYTGQPVSYTVVHYFDGNGNELATTDENGNTTHVSYDKDNRAVLIVDANDVKTAFTYDAKDNRTGVYIGVEAHMDANSHVVIDNDDQAQINTYSYDEFNQVFKKVDGLGNALVSSDDAQYIQMRKELGYVDVNGNGKLVTNLTSLEQSELMALYTERYSYDKVGNLTQAIDNAGNETNIAYDGMNRQTSLSDALGQTTSTRYDGNNNQVNVTDALGRVSSFSYDSNDRLIDSTDANGIVTHREYDVFGNLTAETRAFGTIEARTTTYSYDLNNRVTDSTDPLGHQTHYVYDAVGNTSSQTTAFGTLEAQTTQYSYDALNRAIQTTDALGNITQYDYDGVGNRVKLIDARGGLTEFSYDPGNRLVQTTDAEGRVNSFTYDNRNNRITTTDGKGNVTNFEYDAENNLRAVIDAEGNRTESDYDTVYNRTSTTDGNGHTTNYAFDAINRQISVTDALGQTTSYTFDNVGNRLTITDALQHTRTFTYDDLNRVTTETDADGIQTTYAYDSVSNRTSITYAANTAQAATSTFEYNNDNQLIKQTDAIGNVTTYAYDANHNLLKLTDANTGIITNTYDDANRLITTTDALGHITTFAYDENGNQVQVTDAKGNTSTTYYNANNEVTMGVDNLGYASTFQYDNNGNVISRTLHMTALVGPQVPTVIPTLVASSSYQTVTYVYDKVNRVVSTVDAEGFTTATAYDAIGNALTRTDGNLNVTNYAYDDVNRLQTTTDANGGVTTNSYDTVGNRTSRTDANGHTTNYTFDVVNRLDTITDALGNVTKNVYDAVGNRTSTTDANNHTTNYIYDLNNRIVSQKDALGVVTTYSYDGVGNRITMTTAANTLIAATTTYIYDADNNLISTTDALLNTTSYTYDANHNRVSMTDANSHVTTYVYDDNNRLISKTDAESNTVSYVYDGAGNQVQYTDENGNVTTTYFNNKNEAEISVDALGYATTNVYDANSNIVSQTLHMSALVLPLDPAVVPTIAASVNDQTVAFEYDALNRTSVRIDAKGYRTEFSYDAAGNQVQSRQQITADGSTYAVSNTYYDDVNRIAFSVTAEGYLTSYTYDAVGNRIATTVYNKTVTPQVGINPTPVAGDLGRTTTFSYDAENRLSTQTSALGIITAYEYDERGNRTAVIDAQGSVDERTTSYTYDNLNRLTDTTNGNGVVIHNEYDGVGNVTARYDAYGSAEQRLTTFIYDNNNRVTSSTNAIGVTTSYSYDANSNLLSTTLATGVVGVEQTLTSEYDANNRLVAEVNGEGERSEYVYDGAGNRTEIIQAPGLTEERHNFFEYNNDNQVTATIDALGTRTQYTYDGAGNKTLTIQAVGLSEQRTSLYSNNLDNQLVKVTDPENGVTQYTYDALGNQTQIINANGGVQNNSFDAVGQLINTVSAGGVMTTNVYDDRGNIISMSQSWADGTDARTTTYTFDNIDQQVSITDPEGFTTTISYDEFGNQTSVTNGQYLVDPLDLSYNANIAARAHVTSTSFTFDAASRMTSLTDGVGTVTQYAYDEVGNRTQTIETSNERPRITNYTYDLANRQLTSVNPEGGTVVNVYDALGNKTETRRLQNVDGIGTETWITQSYEYNDNGNMVAEVDSYGTRTEHEYDAMGNMTVHRYAAGTVEERIVRMEYDFNNRLTADIDAKGNRSSYTYDSMGNRSTVTDALGRVAEYTYDASNNLVAILDPEGYTTSYAYDSVGNQTDVTLGERSTSFEFNGVNNISLRTDSDGSETRFEYDAAGNLVKETQYANSTAPRELLYVYDDNSRLIEFTDVDLTVTTFTYDAANNKTSESIYSATDPNSTRTTTYSYDLNNQKTTQTFNPIALDPAGLNYVQTFGYDLAGNIISKIDANGVETAYTYDLNNNVKSLISDPAGLNLTTAYDYDAVNNLISETDGRGNTTDYVYNNNNQQTQVIAAEVTVYTIDGDERLERPTFTRVYDAAGNVIQETNPNGYKTTRYYDGNNRIVAEIDTHNALREYSYNATGEQVEVKLYMTRLSDTDHNPYTRPAAPAGEIRITSNVFDIAGQLVQTLHPETTITTLVGADTNTPSTTAQLIRASESWSYDQFGNQVEYIDKNNNRNVYYYDVVGDMIAHVDGQGYLTEWDYDAQGNQLEQRKYETTLDVALIDSSVYPTIPTGGLDIITNVYDVASRLIEERTPFFDVYNPIDIANPLSQQQVTQYSYDANGNQLSKTIAAGTTNALTEYSYYDNNNRLIAVINGERTLHLYSYDANGNVTKQERLYNAVPMTDGLGQPIDLSNLTAATDFRSLTIADVANDQTTEFVFDALNRKTQETDLMGPNSTDDLTQVYKFNATQQQTWTQDEDGYVTKLAFNGLGLAVFAISADGSGLVTEYDAAGNQISGFMGLVENQTTPATNITATVSDTLNLNWDLGGTVTMRSRVVYGTTSQASTDGYSYQTGLTGGLNQTTGSVAVDLAGFTAGETLYFRVITQDGAGNVAWTEEKSLTIPPRIADISVSQPTSDSIVISANFEGGALNPVLVYGAIQNPTNPVNFVLQADGSYDATITGVTNAEDLAYIIQWSDASGSTYISGEQAFEAQGGHSAVISTVDEGTVTTATGTGYVINLNTKVPTALGETFTVVTAQWLAVNTNTGYNSTANEGVLDASANFYNFDLTLGSSTSSLEAGEYEVIISGVNAEGQSIVLDTLTYTVGEAIPTTLTSQSVSFAAPAVGNSQLVIVDGVRVDSSREGSFASFDVNASATQAYDVYYSNAFTETHTTTVSSTQQTAEIPDPLDPLKTITVVTGYNLDASVTLSTAEAANIAGDVTLYWRTAGAGSDFSNSQVMTLTGNVLTGGLSNVAAGQYDFKIAYTDAAGNEVVVDWYRADSTVASDSITETSQTLLGAEERNGSITLNANGTISVDPGLYLGILNSADLASELSLTVGNTGQIGGTKDANGLSIGYFTEISYNALGQVISETGQDGLYNEYDLDANGNRVATYTYGEKGNPDALISYTAFDARDRTTTQFDAAFIPDGEITARHPETHYSYDYNNNVVSQTDARGFTQFNTYNALGLQTSNIDANGGLTKYYYDIRGNQVAISDASGKTAYKEYDLFGRLTADINGEGNRIEYGHDELGRKTSMSLGGNVTNYSFDQRDRMTSMTDAMDGVTRYEYDSRDNQTWVYDPRWSTTNDTYKYGQQFDEMGRVSESYSYQDGQLATEKRVYDFYGNLIAEVDAMGRVKSSGYEGFARVNETVSETGQRIVMEYDAYGRMTREYDPAGSKDIRYSYDDRGNRTSVDDLATNVSTVYTYDLNGNRISETITTPTDAQGEATHNRSYTYIYDSRGNMVRWDDSVTGMHLEYQYDVAGNLQRAFTDIGYDPDGLNITTDPDTGVETPTDPNFRHVDHWYYYDDANRISMLTNGENGEIISEYRYNSAGERVFWSDNGNAVDYTFDANGQVKTGSWFTGTGADQVTHLQKWTYDQAGNVLSYRVDENAKQVQYSVYSYYENNTQYYSNSKPIDSNDASNSTSTFDLSGRLTGKVTRGDGYAITYSYNYYADGREKSVSASGDSSGSSTITYDANNNKVEVNLGKDNDQKRAEVSTFMYDNEGHIIYKWHDDGKSDTRETVDYAYANGKPVGETGTNNDAERKTELDTGKYNLIENFGDEFPGNSVTLYTVNTGDTLQSIASALYGNPSLWFVIAAANGLSGAEQLDAGIKLTVPNSVESGRITSENHALYNDSDIIGSTLPNLQSAGGGGGCAGLLAIVIVVAIAIIAPYAVAALAGTLTAAVGTIAAYAIAGAVVYAAANIIQQGLLMAIGVQEEFEWGQVGTAAVSGLFAGLAQGVQVEAVTKIKEGQQAWQYAQVASTALKVASVASKQILTDGKITSWTGVIAAGYGQYAKFGGAAANAANAGLASAGAATEAGKALESIKNIQEVVQWTTPWLQLAETYVRNDGELTPQDWAGAIASTVATATNGTPNDENGFDFGTRANNAFNNMGVNLLLAGAIKQSVGSDSAREYFYQSVGNEVGQLLGDYGAYQVQQYDASLTEQRRVAQLAGPSGAAGPSVPSGTVSGTSDVSTGSNVGGTTVQQAPTTATIDNDQNGSLWAVASNQLPAGASDADIQAYTQQLMQVNPGLDPRALSAGTSLTLPTGSEMISADTLAAYNKSDSEYQTYLDDQAFAAVAADFARTNSNGVTSVGIGAAPYAGIGPLNTSVELDPSVSAILGSVGSSDVPQDPGFLAKVNSGLKSLQDWASTGEKEYEQAILAAAANGDDVFGFIATALKPIADGSRNIVSSAAGLVRLATDDQARTDLVNGAEALYDNRAAIPGLVADGVGNFLDKPYYEQAQSAITLTQETLTGAAFAKLGTVGRIADDVVPDIQLIDDVENFTTLGLPANPRNSQSGRLLIQQYRQGGASSEQAFTYAQRNLSSGTALPDISIGTPGDSFYKLVPSGGDLNTNSPYLLSTSQFDELNGGNYNIGDRLALPNSSISDSYDVYRATVSEGQAPLVFRSDIAPSVENNVIRAGGNGQSIIPQASALDFERIFP